MIIAVTLTIRASPKEAMKPHHQYLLFIVGALVLSAIPFVHWPFSWMETFFHEISHGLAAIISGGSIDRIVLHFNGSGLCYTRGGWQPLVSFAGYAGAIVWGAIIYLFAKVAGTNNRWLALLLLGLIVISAVLYVRDIITIVILLVICAALYATFRFSAGNKLSLVMQFAGIYVMVSAARAPLALIDGRHYGDGAALANITWLPEIIWALIWCGMALATMLFLWRMQKPPSVRY